MAGRIVRVYSVPAGDVDRLFDEGGQLFGFSRARLTPMEIQGERAQVLRDALRRRPGVTVGVLPDGRLAAHPCLRGSPDCFAVEEDS